MCSDFFCPLSACVDHILLNKQFKSKVMIIRKKSVVQREHVHSVLNPKDAENREKKHWETYLVTTILFLGIPIYKNQTLVVKSLSGGTPYCSTI